MDNDLVFRQFEEIEQKIGMLIKNFKTLEERNSELEANIERLEQALNRKAEAENRDKAVNTQIRSNVENLLVRLQDVTEG